MTIRTSLVTYSILTPWCRVLLEQLTDLQLVKKLPTFHGTRRFITALTSVRHLSLSCASPIQSIYPHPTSWKSILILSTHLRLGLPSGLLPSGFPTKTLYTSLSSPTRATWPISHNGGRKSLVISGWTEYHQILNVAVSTVAVISAKRDEVFLGGKVNESNRLTVDEMEYYGRRNLIFRMSWTVLPLITGYFYICICSMWNWNSTSV